ncbi:MAG: HDIG domain-containing protein [Anaerolineae bacterium]|nr:HDIG domain-containing protein [Anaerolineae bacterium]
MTRDEAWSLVTEHIQSLSLRRHMLAVEAAMRAYARRFGEDEEYWGAIGLVHDFDFEQHPEMGGDLPQERWHCFAGARILRERGYPEEVVQDVLSHAQYAGVPRDTLLRKALFAVDELTGLISAVALVRPSKSIMDVKVKSVRNKWKDKAFAAAINRQDIEQGAAELGVELNEHIAVVLEAMQGIADDLGLAGEPG